MRGLNLDAIHDSVHEMAHEEAHHGKGWCKSSAYQKKIEKFLNDK